MGNGFEFRILSFGGKRKDTRRSGDTGGCEGRKNWSVGRDGVQVGKVGATPPRARFVMPRARAQAILEVGERRTGFTCRRKEE